MKTTNRQFFFISVLAILAMQTPISLAVAVAVFCIQKVDHKTPIVLRIALSIFFVLLLFVLTKNATLLTSSEHLPQVPQWAICLVFLAAFVYGSFGQPQRLAEFFGMPIFIIAIIINIITYPNPVFAQLRESQALSFDLFVKMEFVFIFCWMFSVLCTGAILIKGAKACR